MKTDTMTVEILADGMLKVSVDPVSAANHGGAEKMLRNILDSLGGDVTTKHRHGKSFHSHADGHGHGEQAKQG